MRVGVRKNQFELVWVINVIFDVNYSYMMLDDCFESNYEDLDVCLIEHDLGCSWFKCAFYLNMFMWIKSGEWRWMRYWMK